MVKLLIEIRLAQKMLFSLLSLSKKVVSIYLRTRFKNKKCVRFAFDTITAFSVFFFFFYFILIHAKFFRLVSHCDKGTETKYTGMFLVH